MSFPRSLLALLILSALVLPPPSSALLMDSEQNYVDPQHQHEERAEGSSRELGGDRNAVSKPRRMVLTGHFYHPSW